MRWGILLGLLLVGCHAADEPQEEKILVFAAASLTDALNEVTVAFEKAHPQYYVVGNIAATSLLARQIEQGAPADVLLSANDAWTSHVAAAGRTEGASITFVENRLAIAGGLEAAPLPSLGSLRDANRIAIADPSHVPAGIYAKAALECEGLWATIEPKTVPMLDVRTALMAVQTGAADVALVYASDIHASTRTKLVFAWPRPCTSPIRYTASRIRGGANPAGAAAFVDFLTDPERAPQWLAHGFELHDP